MTARRLPVFSTIVVIAAVATMVALGIWQYRKVGPQEARLAQHDAALADPTLVSFPITSADVDRFAYRRSRIDCRELAGKPRTVAGRNRQGQVGFVQVVTCTLPDGQSADVQLGWTQSVQPVDWRGGAVEGTIEPLRTGLAKLVADPPLAGLAANARPEKHKIDHLAYAVQWFFFALTALVIYVLALKRRGR
jgi:surfeit locus 1 family protein